MDHSIQLQHHDVLLSSQTQCSWPAATGSPSTAWRVCASSSSPPRPRSTTCLWRTPATTCWTCPATRPKRQCGAASRRPWSSTRASAWSEGRQQLCSQSTLKGKRRRCPPSQRPGSLQCEQGGTIKRGETIGSVALDLFTFVDWFHILKTGLFFFFLPFSKDLWSEKKVREDSCEISNKCLNGLISFVFDGTVLYFVINSIFHFTNSADDKAAPLFVTFLLWYRAVIFLTRRVRVCVSREPWEKQCFYIVRAAWPPS